MQYEVISYAKYISVGNLQLNTMMVILNAFSLDDYLIFALKMIAELYFH